MPRAGTKRPPKPTYDLVCHACGETNTTTRPKAKRCQSCIDAGRKVTTTTIARAEARSGVQLTEPPTFEELQEEARRSAEEDLKERVKKRMQLLTRIVERHHPSRKKRSRRTSAALMAEQRAEAAHAYIDELLDIVARPQHHHLGLPIFKLNPAT